MSTSSKTGRSTISSMKKKMNKLKDKDKKRNVSVGSFERVRSAISTTEMQRTPSLFNLNPPSLLLNIKINTTIQAWHFGLQLSSPLSQQLLQWLSLFTPPTYQNLVGSSTLLPTTLLQLFLLHFIYLFFIFQPMIACFLSAVSSWKQCPTINEY